MKIWILITVFVPLLYSSAGWQLVLKVPQGVQLPSNVSSLYQLWMTNISVNENHEKAKSLADNTMLYKSNIISDWENRNISLVRLAFYTGRTVQAHIVFSAAGPAYNHSDWPTFSESTNQTAWFDCGRVVESSWVDLTPETNVSVCNFSGNSPYGWIMAILQSQYPADTAVCTDTTGWFYVEEGTSIASVHCSGAWPSTGSPHFVFSPTPTAINIKDAVLADMLAVFVDDCVDEAVCAHDSCWQSPLGQCYCNGFRCSVKCSTAPCLNNGTCEVDTEDEEKYTCDCDYGYYGENCQYPWDRHNGVGGELPAGAVVGLCIGVLLLLGIVVGVIWCRYIWTHRDQEYGRRMTERAVMARDFVRRSIRRLSGRGAGLPRQQMHDDDSPKTKQGKSALQLNANSSSVFGAANPAFMADDTTPPTDKRYTEFPTNQQPQSQCEVPMSVDDIQLQERTSQYSRDNSSQSSVAGDMRYQNMPYPPSEHRSTDSSEGLGHGQFDCEVASSMSEVSSASCHSDPRYDHVPANLPPSEMISKDVSGPASRVLPRRSRPRARANYPEQPKRLAPQLPSKHITVEAARSRRYQNVPDPVQDLTSFPRQHSGGRERDVVSNVTSGDVQEATV